MNAQKHPFAPVFDENSKVLILGSFPPINTSQKNEFYYGGTSNVFWKVLGEVFQTPNLADKSIADKKGFLLKNKIALWDIWALCCKKDHTSASDKGIIAKESKKVDLSELLKAAKIQKVFTTIDKGCFKTWHIEDWLWDEYRTYFPHCKSKGEIVVSLFSTSPRGIQTKRVTYEQIRDDYKQIAEILKKG